MSEAGQKLAALLEIMRKAQERGGRIPPAEVLELVAHLEVANRRGRVFLRAYFAAESFALRDGPRQDAQEALDDADDEVEEWAGEVYGDGWRELESVLLPPASPEG